MGASMSLHGRFCYDMDPNSSILVPSLGYTEIIRVLSFSGVVCSEMCKVSDAWRSHTRSTIRVHALTSPWLFSVWGIDIIGKILPKSSSGHEFILVAIDYFTKWVEATSYAKLNAAKVATFIRSHIICRYEVPHELISDRGVHFRGEVDTLLQIYGIQHHRSSTYMPQTNGAVEAANKNIKRFCAR